MDLLVKLEKWHIFVTLSFEFILSVGTYEVSTFLSVKMSIVDFVNVTN